MSGGLVSSSPAQRPRFLCGYELNKFLVNVFTKKSPKRRTVNWCVSEVFVGNSEAQGP